MNYELTLEEFVAAYMPAWTPENLKKAADAFNETCTDFAYFSLDPDAHLGAVRE